MSRRETTPIRRRVFEIMEMARPDDGPSRVFDTVILTLIATNVAAVMLETVDSIRSQYATFFTWFEIVSVAVFTVEYLGRLWTAPEQPRFGPGVAGRLRWMKSPMAVIDLLAVLPFYIPLAIGVDFRFVRMLRMFRLFRLFKLGRYSRSLQALGDVIQRKKEQLVVSLAFSGALLLFASSLLYYVEHQAQPDAFSSIPAAMWWGVATLTTVGYGDVYPVTPLGRLLGAVVAVIGVGLFALPAGILASGLTEPLEAQEAVPEAVRPTCPHCGRALDEGSS